VVVIIANNLVNIIAFIIITMIMKCRLFLTIVMVIVFLSLFRQNQAQTTNFSREGRGEGGRCDLRRVHNENSRLGDQLASLGLV
jgi:hypothetical protein